jgi:hypothetical protein
MRERRPVVLLSRRARGKPSLFLAHRRSISAKID